MSASLQYSDYSETAMTNPFVVPYNLLKPNNAQARTKYLLSCAGAMQTYRELAKNGDNDTAGYAAPQSLRNVLLISATPYQWKHMISQRVCRRNTDETRYVMLKIWELLYKADPTMFSLSTTGPYCCKNHCLEGTMSCHHIIAEETPTAILHKDFPLLYETD